MPCFLSSLVVDYDLQTPEALTITDLGCSQVLPLSLGGVIRDRYSYEVKLMLGVFDRRLCPSQRILGIMIARLILVGTKLKQAQVYAVRFQ